MSVRRILMQGAIVASLGMAALVPANAITHTFASFSYPTSGFNVSYNNATGMLSGVNIPVNFNFVANGIAGSPATGTDPVDAVFSFHAIRKASPFGNVSQTLLGDLQQPLTLTDFTITSVASYTVNGQTGRTNLLSGYAGNPLDDFDFATLSGRRGGSQATLSGSISGGTTINYFSDFVTFVGGVTDADFGFNFNGINRVYSLSSTGDLTNLRGYTAQVTGLFGANSPAANTVPEPGTMAMLLGAGIPVSLFALKLRKKRK